MALSYLLTALLLILLFQLDAFHGQIKYSRYRHFCTGTLRSVLDPGDDVAFTETWFAKEFPNIDRKYRLEEMQQRKRQDEERREMQLLLEERKRAEILQQDRSRKQANASSSFATEEQQHRLRDASADLSDNASPSKKSRKLPLPFLDVESLGIRGRWRESNGNFILEPLDGQRPVGVVHFLGGAFVGAAPHLTYRYLLESLAEEGYLVVTTPYQLNFDYVDICDKILDKFEPVGVQLAETYGPLPVIGIGHSCGALLQTLITSLFPQTPRAVNVLISFNNKPAKEAIPTFEELVVPIAQRVMDEDDANSKSFRQRIIATRKFFESFIDQYAESEVSPAFVQNELVPLYRQTAEILDQFPPLLRSIADGTREFAPSPEDTKEVCRRMYRARRTLVLRFENDEIDESPDIEKVLREANTIMRMKRPMIEMQVDFRTLTGTHITPLTPNVLFDASVSSPIALPDALNPGKSKLLVDFMKTVDDVIDEVVDFLDESVKGNT